MSEQSASGQFRSDLLDPEYAAMLAEFPEFIFNGDTLSLTRELLPGPTSPSDDVDRTDYVVDDSPAVVTLHRPKGASQLLPCMLWMHGGGTFMGNRHFDNDQLERWCRSLSLCSVSVEYRLAPEDPYPAALEDCYRALCWVVEHADKIGVDSTRIGVGGKSAGGLLAAALSLLVRERGGPRIECQILDCPMIDDRERTLSSRVEGVPIWSRQSNEFGWRCYLGERYGNDDLPATAAPGRATDLTGLPPALVIVGALDVLRDEDVDYATRLNQANVPTEVHVYPGVPHGTAMFPGLSINRNIVLDVDDFVRRHLVEGTRQSG